MKTVLPWVTSAFTIVSFWLIGDKKSVGWAVALVNQAVWVVFIVVFEAWGLLVLTAFLTYINTRSLIRWRRDERAMAEVP